MLSSPRQHGFTMVEAIVVIVVTAIIGSVVTIFMKGPIDGYFASINRMQLADAADGALRYVSRDIRSALPRSFRNPSSSCLEFLPVVAGGRYCRLGDGSGCTMPVKFGEAFGSFDVIGGLDYIPQAGDRVVFHNLGLSGNDAYADPMAASTNVAIAGAGSNLGRVVLSTAKTLPAALGLMNLGNAPDELQLHFFVLPATEQAVFYVCDGAGSSNGNGTGRLLRLKAYGINASPPSVCPASLAGATVLASQLSKCSINWRALGLSERLDVVSLELEISRNGESVRLIQEVQVYNDP